MALGLNEGSTQQERIDEHFLACVQRILVRSLTSTEEEIAIGVRDQHGYDATEAATEILAHMAPPVTNPHAPVEELRETALIDLTRQKSAGLLAAVRARQPQASKLIRDCLSEYLTDNQALSTLILESLASTNSLQGVITDLIWAEAETMAQLELAAIERENRELSTADRIDRYFDSIAA